MDRTCLVAWEGSFRGDEGTRAEADVCEDLAEVGCSAEVGIGFFISGNCG